MHLTANRLIIPLRSGRPCWLRSALSPELRNCRPGRIHPFRVPNRRQRQQRALRRCWSRVATDRRTSHRSRHSRHHHASSARIRNVLALPRASLDPSASHEVLDFPTTLTGRVALFGRCRLPNASRFDVSCSAFPSAEFSEQPRPCGFPPSNPDGCSPACGDWEMLPDVSANPLHWRRRLDEEDSGRSVGASQSCRRISATARRIGRPCTPDCINRFVVRRGSCAAAPSVARRSATRCSTDSAAWLNALLAEDSAFVHSAALLGFECGPSQF